MNQTIHQRNALRHASRLPSPEFIETQRRPGLTAAGWFWIGYAAAFALLVVLS